MERLLMHFIDEQRERNTEFKRELHEIKVELQTLREFKVELLAESRSRAIVVSGICGFITMVSTLATVYVTLK